ncbi:hypothetical protein BDQ12DRAFT_681924 [Crucibulum laeve]|uniref:Secreted protein n=1 Tax=Crucibulum laeve TaxID=68775 RepID=A0A5C3M440_9AGAR|nr:hypothetical protein BDQ12DRAFT_681924 [Crucibulum laeve]
MKAIIPLLRIVAAIGVAPSLPMAKSDAEFRSLRIPLTSPSLGDTTSICYFAEALIKDASTLSCTMMAFKYGIIKIVV